jgi:DNA-binding NtrC family response regulator
MDVDPRLASENKPARRPVRNVGRLLDAAGEGLWIIGQGHSLIYLNASAAQWLGVDPQEVLGRVCHAAADRDAVAGATLAAIAAPIGLVSGQAKVVSIQLPGCAPRCVRFSHHGSGDDTIIVAITGAVPNAVDDEEVEAALAVRQRLESWRRHQASTGLIVAAGTSRHALRIRTQVQLAGATRQHIAIVGPRGSGGESIARRIHALALKLSQPTEPLIVVETPLMDAELLEASLSPAAAHLSRRSNSFVTLILRGVDESPHDVQDRIIHFTAQAAGAVRLIGLLGQPPSFDSDPGPLTAKMALALSVFEVSVAPLVKRPEDIPLIATAMIETRHAAGKSVAERISRAALDRLLLYPWPDNHDELESAMRHAAGVCRTVVIGVDDLPLSVRSFRTHAAPQRKPIVATNLDDAMREFELKKIRQAIEWAGGNRSEAARSLGISRARLLRRIDGVDDEVDHDKADAS